MINYKKLQEHIGHELECVGYSNYKIRPRVDYQSVSIECITCNTVLVDFDKPEKLKDIIKTKKK